MYNWCMVEGRLVREPLIKLTKAGKNIANFTLACNGTKKGDNDNTLFQDCVAWEKKAEIITNYVKKGNRVLVAGRLHTNTYTDKDGVKRSKNIMTVADVSLQDNRLEENNRSSYNDGEENVFTALNSFAEISDDIDDGELPF